METHGVGAGTDVWESLTCFGFQAELFFDEPIPLRQHVLIQSSSSITYSAAVCELSDACEMLLARGFEAPAAAWRASIVVL